MPRKDYSDTTGITTTQNIIIPDYIEVITVTPKEILEDLDTLEKLIEILDGPTDAELAGEENDSETKEQETVGSTGDRRLNTNRRVYRSRSRPGSTG